jgi:hypothetical protein
MFAITVAPDGGGGTLLGVGVGLGIGVGVPDCDPEPEDEIPGVPVKAVVVVPASGLATPEAPHPTNQNPANVTNPTAQNRFRFRYIRQPFGRQARLSGQTTEASTLDVSGESSRRVTEFALEERDPGKVLRLAKRFGKTT